MPPHPMRRKSGPVALMLLVGWTAPTHGQSTPLVDMKDLAPQEHRVGGFILTTPQFIQIDAVGAEPRDQGARDDDEPEAWPAAAWILDARTRQVIWDLRTAETTSSGKGIRRFSGLFRLPAGVYEAHYAAYVATWVSREGAGRGLISLRRKSRQVGDTWYRGPYVDDDSFRQFELRVTGAGRPARKRELTDAATRFAGSALVSLWPDTVGSYLRTAFELGRAADVELLALGELRGDDAFDHGWIINADSRTPVWRMESGRSRPAGGAGKNRMVHDTLHLPAGRYVAYFAGDDSHGPGAWNAVPPWDARFWGLTLWVRDAAARAAARRIDWAPVPAGQTIVSLIRIGNDALRSRGFTLRRALEVRIYAIGECSSLQREGDDYAWIVNATTRRRVWEMRCEDTQPAGGADKNRLFDGTVKLGPGSYRVYYRSDGSHSYARWNSPPPVESRYWGVSVFPASGKLDPRIVGPLQPDTIGVLAELVRVPDSRHWRRPFALAQPAAVRVYAIGEGVDGDMVDYGWIEDERSGSRVWEMKYAVTSEAGGASKNRLFEGTVQLPAGRYILHYQTDGSHAYGDWNADPPDEPEGWGISLRRDAGL